MSETKPGHIPEADKENKETEPKITVDFLFSYHGTDADSSRFPEALKNADVYVPEAIEWTAEEEQLANEISQGKIKPTEHEKGISWLYNLKIPIVFVDLPKGHPLNKEWRGHTQITFSADRYFLSGNFDVAVQKIKEGIIGMASDIKDREDFIADKLKNELQTLTQKFPQLKNKKDIRILVTLGAAHTSLYKKLKSKLQLPKKMLGRDTLVFDTMNEIVRSLVNNPQKVVNDDLYTKSLMETFIQNVTEDLTEDSNKVAWTSRKLAANLSTDQIRSFSKTRKDTWGKVNKEEFLESSIKKLEEMGVKLPTNEEEIDKLLNIRKK